MHGLGSVSCRGVTWRAKWSLGFILQYRCMKAKNRVRMSHRNQHGVTDIRLYHTWPPTRLFNPTYKNMDTELMSRAVRLFTFPPTTGACLVSELLVNNLAVTVTWPRSGRNQTRHLFGASWHSNPTDPGCIARVVPPSIYMAQFHFPSLLS